MVYFSTYTLDGGSISEDRYGQNEVEVSAAYTAKLFLPVDTAGDNKVKIEIESSSDAIQARQDVFWKVTKAGTALDEASIRSTDVFDWSNANTSDLLEVHFGIDLDKDGQLEENEYHISSELKGLGIDSITIDQSRIYYVTPHTQYQPVHQAFIAFYLSDPEAIWTQAITDRIGLERSISSPASQDPYPSSSESISGPTLLPAAGGLMFLYGAPVENVSLKHPPQAILTITAQMEDINIKQPTINPTLEVYPVFFYWKNTNRDMAIKYVNQKYSIVSTATFDSDFSYGGNSPGFRGYTSAYTGRKVVIYDDAIFAGENVVASTIGHENVHYNQPLEYFINPFFLFPDGKASKELPAYIWERDNADLTGIDAAERDHIEQMIQDCIGISEQSPPLARR